MSDDQFANNTAKQNEILRRASVSRPEDLPDPHLKLDFANAGGTPLPHDPLSHARFHLDGDRVVAAKLEPLSRLELVETAERATRGHAERLASSSSLNMSNDDYLRSLKGILPYAKEESAKIIRDILQSLGATIH